MNKNLLLKIGVLAAVIFLTALLVRILTPPKKVEVTNNVPVGALPGADLNSPYFSVNGAQLFYFSGLFKNFASSTACSFKLPSATTTPIVIAAKVTENTGGTELVIGNAINNFGTTTLLAKNNGVAGRKFIDLVATTTATALPGSVFSPSTYINFSIEKQSTATGTCMAIVAGL